MKVDNIEDLRRIIRSWDGKIVIDTYDVRGHKGIAVLSLVKNDEIYSAIKFEGDNSDIISLFTDVLKKNIDKVVDEQKVRVQYTEKDIKRRIKKLRHNP